MTDASRRPDDARSARGEVLRLLRDEGPLPRIALARASGLSPTSITRTVNALQDDRLIVEGDTIAVNRLGRRATEVRLATDVAYVVGVQIGVGFVQIGILDVLGRTIASREFSYPLTESAETVLATTATTIRALVDATRGVRLRDVIGVGVAAPGAVDDENRRVIMPVNITWRDIPVSDILEHALELPVLVEHNVRSMALAEARFGAGRERDSVAFVYLRTGLGAGLTLAGQPFSGGVHGAIEIGHLKTDPENRECRCGGHGCLETVVADHALREDCDRYGLAVGPAGPLGTLYAHAADHPEVAARVDHIIDQLAVGLSNLGTLLNPQIIFLGGVLADMPDAFVEALRDRTRASLFFLIRESVQLERSSLGLNAGVTGGGALALDTYFYA